MKISTSHIVLSSLLTVGGLQAQEEEAASQKILHTHLADHTGEGAGLLKQDSPEHQLLSQYIAAVETILQTSSSAEKQTEQLQKLLRETKSEFQRKIQTKPFQDDADFHASFTEYRDIVKRIIDELWQEPLPVKNIPKTRINITQIPAFPALKHLQEEIQELSLCFDVWKERPWDMVERRAGINALWQSIAKVDIENPDMRKELDSPRGNEIRIQYGQICAIYYFLLGETKNISQDFEWFEMAKNDYEREATNLAEKNPLKIQEREREIIMRSSIYLYDAIQALKTHEINLNGKERNVIEKADNSVQKKVSESHLFMRIWKEHLAELEYALASTPEEFEANCQALEASEIHEDVESYFPDLQKFLDVSRRQYMLCENGIDESQKQLLLEEVDNELRLFNSLWYTELMPFLEKLEQKIQNAKKNGETAKNIGLWIGLIWLLSLLRKLKKTKRKKPTVVIKTVLPPKI